MALLRQLQHERTGELPGGFARQAVLVHLSNKPQAADDNKATDWTFEEEELLRAAVFQYGGKKWKTISTSMLGWRSPTQCNVRWNELQNLHNAVKSPWSAAEDARMMELVGKYGPGRWAVIASYLQGRNGKQCRERWHNQLNPAIKKDSWTVDEDQLIIELQAKLGNAWAKIADRLSGRTDNAVKNRWHSSLLKSNTSRSRRQPKKRGGAGKSTRKATAAEAKKKKPSSKACNADSNGVSSPTAVDTNLRDLSEQNVSCPPLSPPPAVLLVPDEPQSAATVMIKTECEEPQSFHELLAAQSFGMEPDEDEENLDATQPSFEAVATPAASYSPLVMLKMFSGGTESDVDADTASCESFTFSHCSGISSLIAEDPGPCVVVKDEFAGKPSDFQLLHMEMQLEDEDHLYNSVWRGDSVAAGGLDLVSVVNMAPLLGDHTEELPSSLCGGDAFLPAAAGPFAFVASDTCALFSGGFPPFPMPRDEEMGVSVPSYCDEDILL